MRVVVKAHLGRSVGKDQRLTRSHHEVHHRAREPGIVIQGDGLQHLDLSLFRYLGLDKELTVTRQQ